MAYLILEALALICGVVVVALAVIAGIAAMSITDSEARAAGGSKEDYYAVGIVAIGIGAIYAIVVGKFSSNLLISISCN